MYVSGHCLCKLDWLFALTQYAPEPKDDEGDYFKIKFEQYC